MSQKQEHEKLNNQLNINKLLNDIAENNNKLSDLKNQQLEILKVNLLIS